MTIRPPSINGSLLSVGMQRLNGLPTDVLQLGRDAY